MFIYTTLSKKRFNKNFIENLIKWYCIWIFIVFAFQTSNRLCRKFNHPIEDLLNVLGSWALGDKARLCGEGGLGPGKVKRSLCTRSFWKMGELWSIEMTPTQDGILASQTDNRKEGSLLSFNVDHEFPVVVNRRSCWTQTFSGFFVHVPIVSLFLLGARPTLYCFPCDCGAGPCEHLCLAAGSWLTLCQ